MRIAVLAVGRLKAGPEKELFESYAKLIRDLGRKAGISAFDVREIAEVQAATPSERRRDEAKALSAAIPRGALMIALDGGGKELTSEAFAADLARRRDAGQHLAFLIGGPDGLGPDLLKQASSALSLGRATWPHRLARVMLAEQIYRSVTILLNHPYHRA